MKPRGPEPDSLPEYEKHLHLGMQILSPRNVRWHLGLHSGTSKERLLWLLIISEITTSSGISNREDQTGSFKYHLLKPTWLHWPRKVMNKNQTFHIVPIEVLKPVVGNEHLKGSALHVLSAKNQQVPVPTSIGFDGSHLTGRPYLFSPA